MSVSGNQNTSSAARYIEHARGQDGVIARPFQSNLPGDGPLPAADPAPFFTSCLSIPDRKDTDLRNRLLMRLARSRALLITTQLKKNEETGLGNELDIRPH